MVAGYPDAFGDSAQPDRDGFMSKSLYGNVNNQFSDEFSGFFRGYGFDNRSDYDGSLVYDNATFSLYWACRMSVSSIARAGILGCV